MYKNKTYSTSRSRTLSMDASVSPDDQDNHEATRRTSIAPARRLKPHRRSQSLTETQAADVIVKQHSGGSGGLFRPLQPRHRRGTSLLPTNSLTKRSSAPAMLSMARTRRVSFADERPVRKADEDTASTSASETSLPDGVQLEEYDDGRLSRSTSDASDRPTAVEYVPSSRRPSLCSSSMLNSKIDEEVDIKALKDQLQSTVIHVPAAQGIVQEPDDSSSDEERLLRSNSSIATAVICHITPGQPHGSPEPTSPAESAPSPAYAAKNTVTITEELAVPQQDEPTQRPTLQPIRHTRRPSLPAMASASGTQDTSSTELGKGSIIARKATKSALKRQPSQKKLDAGNTNHEGAKSGSPVTPARRRSALKRPSFPCADRRKDGTAAQAVQPVAAEEDVEDGRIEDASTDEEDNKGDPMQNHVEAPPLGCPANMTAEQYKQAIKLQKVFKDVQPRFASVLQTMAWLESLGPRAERALSLWSSYEGAYTKELAATKKKLGRDLTEAECKHLFEMVDAAQRALLGAPGGGTPSASPAAPKRPTANPQQNAQDLAAALFPNRRQVPQGPPPAPAGPPPLNLQAYRQQAARTQAPTTVQGLARTVSAPAVALGSFHGAYSSTRSGVPAPGPAETASRAADPQYSHHNSFQGAFLPLPPAPIRTSEKSDGSHGPPGSPRNQMVLYGSQVNPPPVASSQLGNSASWSGPSMDTAMRSLTLSSGTSTMRASMRTCMHCGSESSYAIACRGCNSAWYCNEACMQKGAPGHQGVCRVLRASSAGRKTVAPASWNM